LGHPQFLRGMDSWPLRIDQQQASTQNGRKSN
jgi:hypothetical protein